MNWSVLLRLGRVSNLPTVWSNVLAGAIIASGAMPHAVPLQPLLPLLGLMLALSALYCAGMVLNDAFDREIDARERPNRPIPSGQISARAVFGLGYGLMLAGIVLLAWFGLNALLFGMALATSILLYNLRHKGNPVSPVVMGVCRALVYCVAASAAMSVLDQPLPPMLLLLPALALWAHVVGLTYAAKQENLNQLGSVWPLLVLALPFVLLLAQVLLPQSLQSQLSPHLSPHWSPSAAANFPAQFSVSGSPQSSAALWHQPWPWLSLLALLLADIWAVRILLARATPRAVPMAVAQMIAAISLLDALVIALAGGPWPACVFCLVAYGLTRVMQRFIPGT